MESEWLREAIQFSLKATYSTTLDTPLDDPKEPQHDPRRQKLLDGLHYSRSLILTYQVVIISVILLFTIVHWTEICLHWRRNRASKALKDDPINSILYDSQRDSQHVCSSGSSTIVGTASPPRKFLDETEDTPLLHQNHTLRPRYRRKSIRSLTKAFLLYQPPPIPVINKTLSTNAESLVILAFFTLNLFYMFSNINFTTVEIFVFADRIGLVFVANLPLLYLLAAKNQPLKVLTGRSYESLNIFHRRLGELLCLQGFLHCAGMFLFWYTFFRPVGFGLGKFLLLDIIWLGLGAFFSYEILYFTSLGSFRQRWYELFLGLHVVLQVAALVFLFFHHHAARPYVGVAIGIFLIDRLVYRIFRKSETFRAQVEILEDGETVKLSSTLHRRPLSHITSFFGTSISGSWAATDHAFITVPSLARKHAVQAHPFTIASSTPLKDSDELRLEFLIRAQDGFSRDLLHAALTHSQLSIRVDGPYGSSHARNMLEDSDLALIIAGGSGIAVAWPLVQHLLDSTRSSDTEIASLFSLRKQKIVLIWVIHQGSHLSWIGRQALADAENRGAEILVPRATEEIGRPDLAGMVRGIVDDFTSARSRRIRVVASGPDSMGRLVRNTCASLVRNGEDVDVMFEKFGW